MIAVWKGYNSRPCPWQLLDIQNAAYESLKVDFKMNHFVSVIHEAGEGLFQINRVTLAIYSFFINDPQVAFGMVNSDTSRILSRGGCGCMAIIFICG